MRCRGEVTLRRWPLGTLLAFALAACGGHAPPAYSTGIRLDGQTEATAWSVADTRGTLRSGADFHGRVLVLYFGFTSCPDACPTALARMVSVRRALGMNAVGLQVALVTLDPERDTRERLAAYVAAFDPGFLGLRPEPGTVDAIAAPFRVYHHRTATGDGYTIDHSGLLYVVDCSGRKRLAFRPEETPAQMAAALRPLLAEAGCQLPRD